MTLQKHYKNRNHWRVHRDTIYCSCYSSHSLFNRCLHQKWLGMKIKRKEKGFPFSAFHSFSWREKSPALLDDAIDRTAQYLATDFNVFIRLDIYLTIYSYVRHTRRFLVRCRKVIAVFLFLYNVNRMWWKHYPTQSFRFFLFPFHLFENSFL